jgi:EpsI family protein
MSSNRIAFVIAGMMCAASIGALFARPATSAVELAPSLSLETMIPKQFGDWREDAQRAIEVINPQIQEMIEKGIYNQVLTRSYLNGGGYRIMLSLVYGADARARGSLQVHKPEACYAAQGFLIQKNEAGMLATASGGIPVRRLFATMGTRQEPLIYWFTVGGTAVQGKLEKKLVDLRYTFTGRIPDGLLFRVSSIDADQAAAYQMQALFINQLLQAVSPAERTRLSGLGVL